MKRTIPDFCRSDVSPPDHPTHDPKIRGPRDQVATALRPRRFVPPFGKKRCLLVLAAAVLMASGCGEQSNDTRGKVTLPTAREPNARQTSPAAAASQIRFTDKAAAWGVNFVPRNGREQNHFTILESLGTGVAITDIDADGRPDIIAAGGGTFDQSGQPVGLPTGLFRQRPQTHFSRVVDAAGLNSHSAYTHGIATADWDNDGFEDVLITGYRTVRLFQNCGDGTFVDVTERAGLQQDAWSTSAAFLDADGDGNVELFVTNYVDWWPDPARECYVKGRRDVCPPGEFQAQHDHFYRSQGDGTFAECARDVGITEAGKGLAVISGDVDLDGDTDLYVANDTTANLLYLNSGSGQFVESGLISGSALGATAEAEGSMGVDFADFDLDGFPDIWVSNYENQSFAMYQSRGPAIFQHVSQITGISAVGQLYVGFGTVALDADLDGDQDIFAANGHVMYSTGRAPAEQRPLFYENLDGQNFRNIADQTGDYGRQDHMGRGVAAGDLDGDGRTDLVVAHSNAPLAVLQNQTPPRSRSFRVRLIGRPSNRSAIGAHLTWADGSRLRLATNGGSYLSAKHNQLEISQPMDAGSNRLDIHWPSGVLQKWDCDRFGLNVVVEPSDMN